MVKHLLSIFLAAVVVLSQKSLVVAETQECDNPDMIDPKCPTRVRFHFLL